MCLTVDPVRRRWRLSTRCVGRLSFFCCCVADACIVARGRTTPLRHRHNRRRRRSPAQRQESVQRKAALWVPSRLSFYPNPTVIFVAPTGRKATSTIKAVNRMTLLAHAEANGYAKIREEVNKFKEESDRVGILSLRLFYFISKRKKKSHCAFALSRFCVSLPILTLHPSPPGKPRKRRHNISRAPRLLASLQHVQ